METKIQKEYIDHGFGFPVRLTSVTMVKVRGIWTPKIKFNDLARIVILVLSKKQSRLTGNEIKFIRTYFELTLQEFAKRFCVTHVGVMKWEKVKSAPTSMHWSTEKDIRLFILEKLNVKPTELAKLYSNLAILPTHKEVTLRVDATDLAV